MDIVLWGSLAAIFIILILMWRKAGRRHKCRNCRHFAEHYITSLHGQGLFRFGYCQRLVHDTRIVEPDIDRECPFYEVVEVAEEAARGTLEKKGSAAENGRKNF